MLPYVYDFDDRLDMSRDPKQQIMERLKASIAGATEVRFALNIEQRRGLNYWVTLESGDVIGVDVHVREEDWLETRGYDDLALETWSVIDPPIPGWTRDPKRPADYVFWLWRDSGRWLITSMPLLRTAFIQHWENWRGRYPKYVQKTHMKTGKSYKSECIFVPRPVVFAAMDSIFRGDPQPTGPNPNQPKQLTLDDLL